jgi:hypothetical protein
MTEDSNSKRTAKRRIEKLSWESRRSEFYRVSDAMRAAMVEKGLSEERVLADFDSFRRNQVAMLEDSTDAGGD